MDEKRINDRMDALEKKLDTILDYVNQQRLKSESVDDLVKDVSIIGKEFYDCSVRRLDEQNTEIDPELLWSLGLNLIKNLNNINQLLEMLGSVMDLVKDVEPIANEVIIDFTKKLGEFERKGYFEFLKEMGSLADKVVTQVKPEDIRAFADNSELLVKAMKNLSNPALLTTLNNAVEAVGSVDLNNLPQYSTMQLIRELNSKEMKASLGFLLTVSKNFSKMNSNQ